jgi:hypothetical protein
MPEMKEASGRMLDSSQATELALLVDLEARWENLRKTPFQASEAGDTMQDLHRKQKAYDVFRSQLVAYNKLYTPAQRTRVVAEYSASVGIMVPKDAGSVPRCGKRPPGSLPGQLVGESLPVG